MVGVLVEYSLHERVLQIDTIKEDLTCFFSVFTDLRQLSGGWDSTYCLL